MRVMCSVDPLSRELRANSPFLGLLSDDERRTIITSAYAASPPPNEAVALSEASA